jgi:hypothetical protein
LNEGFSIKKEGLSFMHSTQVLLNVFLPYLIIFPIPEVPYPTNKQVATIPVVPHPTNKQVATIPVVPPPSIKEIEKIRVVPRC